MANVHIDEEIVKTLLGIDDFNFDDTFVNQLGLELIDTEPHWNIIDTILKYSWTHETPLKTLVIFLKYFSTIRYLWNTLEML